MFFQILSFHTSKTFPSSLHSKFGVGDTCFATHSTDNSSPCLLLCIRMVYWLSCHLSLIFKPTLCGGAVILNEFEYEKLQHTFIRETKYFMHHFIKMIVCNIYPHLQLSTSDQHPKRHCRRFLPSNISMFQIGS